MAKYREIVVRNGRAVWHDSYVAIKSERLADAVRAEIGLTAA